jgi:hypothetical protein
MDPEILLAHDECPRPGCEGERQGHADGHPVYEAGDPAYAEVCGHNGGDEDDAEHQTPVEPPLDQESLERIVPKLPPVLIAHDRSSVRGESGKLAAVGRQIYYLASFTCRVSSTVRGEGQVMTNHSLDRPREGDPPVRVEVITYVPTQFNH